MRRYRSGIAVGLMMTFLGLASSATAVEARGGPGGNSAAAKLCQQEWQTLLTADGESFKNIGKCVSYAAKGGVFATPDPEPELDFRTACGSFGAVFGTEQRNAVEVGICTPLAEISYEDAEALRASCEGVLTTERRGDVDVYVCTPMS